MRNYLYLNINGFYGTLDKDRVKLKSGLDDDCCLKNAESICKRIVEAEPLKHDVVFFSEFAPNTPTGKWVTKYFAQNGYRRVLPNGYDNIENYYYSIVVAYVREDLNITKSKPSPKGWLTWCEIPIDNQNIVGIHSTRTDFLKDMKEEVKDRKEKSEELIIFGDTNVTEESDDEEQKKLMNEIVGSVGIEVFDEGKKNTFREIRKPDRVFSNINDIEFSVINGFFEEELSDHDALRITLK